MPQYAKVPVFLTGDTTTTSLATYATWDVKDPVTGLPEAFWTDTTYTIVATHTGIKSDGQEHASYHRLGMYHSDSSGNWTEKSHAGHTQETDSTYTIGEVVSGTGFAVQGRGNSSSAHTVHWMFSGYIEAISINAGR